MKKLMILGLLSALSLAGCKKEPPPEPEKAAEAPPPEPTRKEKKKKEPKIDVPDFSPSAPKTKVKGPATAADFEAEAEKTLHFENLEAELDRLEAEITGG